MAWDGYINQSIISKKVADKAFLIDLAGQSVWGKSEGIELSPVEVNNIAFAFNNDENAQKDGISVGGRHYFYLQIVEQRTEEQKFKVPVMHCRKGQDGWFAAKCVLSILVLHYPEGIFADKLLKFILNQAEYLIEQNK